MTQHMLAVGKSTPDYSIIEVLPGLCLIVLRTENAADVAVKWAAFLDETERRPGMADEAAQLDEAAELDARAERDQNLAAYLAASGAPADFAEAVLAVKAGREVWSSGVNWAAVEDEPWGD